MTNSPIEDDVDITPQARTFILCLLALAYPMFSSGFELGAYGELIYERKMTALAIATAVWLGFCLVPRTQTGIRNWQLVVLAVPSIWLLSVGFFSTSFDHEIVKPVLFGLGLVSCLLCFPFAVYLAVKVINPEFLDLSGWPPKIGIVMAALSFLLVGFLIGDNHSLFLTCSEFEVAGSMLPAGCTR